MSNFHLHAKPFVDRLKVNSAMILEIGSERGEGSTAWFDSIANDHWVDFYSVDVTDFASKTLNHLRHTTFVIAKSGAEWTKKELPKLKKQIKILYLDNYDWISTMDNIRPAEQKLIDEYNAMGVKMSNFDCQREHLEQMINCMPYMHDQSLVICDDTPYSESAGVYFGKNGPVIPYLIIHGYKIVYSGNNGCILARGIK